MPYRTTPKMAQRKDARRRRFLDTATRLFGQQGYHATTVPMIVAATGSSTGSFYFYFRNKEDVFAAALEGLGARISHALDKEIPAQRDPLEQMKAAVKALFVFLSENEEEARILLVESSGLGGRLEQIRRNILSSHARGVEQALLTMANQLPPLDCAVVARCWVGAVFEAVRYWIEQPAEHRTPAEEVARNVAEFNLRAIGATVELT